MTGEVKSKNPVVQFGAPSEVCPDIARSPREDKKRPASSSARDEEVPTPISPNIVAVEQWICLLLGFVCIACGGLGICMNYSLDLSSGYVSWLGSAYEPTLRLTAVACLVSGAVLVRRGLARPDMSSVSDSRKVLRSAGGNSVGNAKRTPVRGRV